MDQLWSFTIFYSGFAGISIGMVYMVPFVNAYRYYPNRKGMCSGLMMMADAIGSFNYNLIFRAIVNPENIPADDEHFFPPSVANNFPKSIRYLCLVYFVLSVTGALLIF